MTKPAQQTFILHLWWEQTTAVESGWRGRVQHVLSGETFYFQEPEKLWQFVHHWSGNPLSSPCCFKIQSEDVT